MERKEKYEELKMKLILLSLGLNSSIVDITALPLYCPWLYDNERLFESFTRLIDIHNINHESISDVVNYVQQMDKKRKECSVDDLSEEVDFISENMYLQEVFRANMIRYINLRNHYRFYLMDEASIYNRYEKVDNDVFDKVQVNKSLIKIKQEERRDNLE